MKPKILTMAALALLVGLPGAAVAQKFDRDNLLPQRQGDGGGGGGGRGNNFGGGGGGGSPRSFDVRPEFNAPRVRNGGGGGGGGGGLSNPQIRKPPKFDPPSAVRPNRPPKPDNDRPGFGKPGNNAGNKPFRPPHVDKPHDNDRKPPRWRPGHRWRVIVVPSVAYGASLGWCHYHRYRVPGLQFHRDVRCHYHGRWADPSIVYVSGY